MGKRKHEPDVEPTKRFKKDLEHDRIDKRVNGNPKEEFKEIHPGNDNPKIPRGPWGPI